MHMVIDLKKKSVQEECTKNVHVCIIISRKKRETVAKFFNIIKYLKTRRHDVYAERNGEFEWNEGTKHDMGHTWTYLYLFRLVFK